MGLPIENLTSAIAAAFLFHNPKDEESVALQKYVDEKGIELAITHFTGIKDATIRTKIRDFYIQLKKKRTLLSH